MSCLQMSRRMEDQDGAIRHNGGRKVLGLMILTVGSVTSLRIGQLPVGTMIGQVPLGTIIGGAALAGIGDGVTGEEAHTCR